MRRPLIAAAVTTLLLHGCGGGSGTPLPGASNRTATIRFEAVTTSAALRFQPLAATVDRFWIPAGVTVPYNQAATPWISPFVNFSAGLTRVKFYRQESTPIATNPLFDGIEIIYDASTVSPATLEAALSSLNPSPAVELSGIDDTNSSVSRTVPCRFTVTP